MRFLFVLLLISVASLAQHEKHSTQTNHKTATDTHPPQKYSSAIKQTSTYEPANYGAYVKNEAAPEAPLILGLKPGEFVQSVIAVVLAVITGIYAVFTFCMVRRVGEQVHLMKGQLAEMKNSRRETVREMKAAGDQTKSMLTQVEIQAGKMGILAAAMTNSVNALVESERAWIDGEFVTEDGEKYTLKIINHGRTPAKIDIYKCGIACIPKGQKADDPPGDLSGYLDNNILVIPHASYSLTDMSLHDCFRYEWDDIATDKQQAFLYAVIIYEDMIGKTHQTSFCYKYRTRSRKMEELRDRRKYT